MKKYILPITVGLFVSITTTNSDINTKTMGFSKDLLVNFDDNQKCNTTKMNPDIDINNNEEIINTDVNVLLESF
jgi:hypothetical protein